MFKMNNDIKELNTALKGEHMAIESFDYYIQDAKDEGTKKNLMDIQQQHQFHAMQLSERIQKLGGNPVNSSGVTGVMAEIKNKVTPKKYVDNNMIKSIVQGEELGIQAYGDIMANLSDASNQRLTEEMMIESIRIVEKLNDMK
jgi:DNA-binding ferritin-like protein